MKTRSVVTVILTVLFFSVFFAAGFSDSLGRQEEPTTKLRPKDKAFLAEFHLLMTDEEKRVFEDLKSGDDRDYFMDTFWQSRGRRGSSPVHENIKMLMILRLTQALDLTEEQAAVIFPKMNQIENEKWAISQEMMQKMRQLRGALGKEDPGKTEVAQTVEDLRTLRERLRDKEQELDAVIMDNVTLSQKARYLLFAQEFYRGLREKLERARRLRELRR